MDKKKVKIELYNDHFEEWRDIKGYGGLYMDGNLKKEKKYTIKLINDNFENR